MNWEWEALEREPDLRVVGGAMVDAADERDEGRKIGLMSATAILTFRRGQGLIGLWAVLFTLTSGACLPIRCFPAGLRRSLRSIR